MARTKEQDAAYQRERRRKKRLAKAGLTNEHAACDRTIDALRVELGQARDKLRERAAIEKTLHEAIDGLTKDVNGAEDAIEAGNRLIRELTEQLEAEKALNGLEL